METQIRKAGIPRRFQEAGFDNFQPTCASVLKALMFCRQYADEYPLVDRGVLFQGPCGVGKTHLAVAILRTLLSRGVLGLFCDFRELLKNIQDSYSHNSPSSESSIVQPVVDAEVLVVDELGAGKPTEWVQETITYIINKRYNDCRVTLFTTNYLDNATGSVFETLTDRVGLRLRSRLHEMCAQIVIDAGDYRITSAAAQRQRLVTKNE